MAVTRERECWPGHFNNKVAGRNGHSSGLDITIRSTVCTHDYMCRSPLPLTDRSLPSHLLFMNVLVFVCIVCLAHTHTILSASLARLNSFRLSFRYSTHRTTIQAKLTNFLQRQHNSAPARIKSVDFHGYCSSVKNIFGYGSVNCNHLCCIKRKKRKRARLESKRERNLEQFSVWCLFVYHLIRDKCERVSKY